MDKSELKRTYNLSKAEKKQAKEIFGSVNPSRRIEYIDKLIAAGFTPQKIRAVSHTKELCFKETSAARPVHIQKIADVIWLSNEYHYLRYFAACVADVLSMCGYRSNRDMVQKQIGRFQQLFDNEKSQLDSDG